MRARTRRRSFAAALIAGWALTTMGQATDRAVLVELFTSEGCSSCPPADALLAKLNGTGGADGVLIVGLSEHVTYWNRLGWADPFSQELFTRRQSGYGERFHLDSVYTPQVVVGGDREMSGGDERGILQAVRAAGHNPGRGVRIVSTELSGAGLTVSFMLAAGLPKTAEVYAAIAQDRATVPVLRGENSGRTLTHVSIVRSLMRLGEVGEVSPQSAVLPIPAGLSEGRHVVLFVQERGLGKVLAVESRSF